MTPQAALQRVIEHREIFNDEMISLMRQIMGGEVTPVMIAAILAGLRVKKETIGEIAAAAKVMRELAVPVVVPRDPNLVDIVGTGGDAAHSFNISTAAIFVTAAAGAKVVKHGGRSVSSSSGSADVLEAMGANIMLNPQQVAECIAETGIGFMFAPNHHPAMKNVAPVRREMGVRTLFNILGPLTNPAGVKRQLTGAFSDSLIRPMAETLLALGTIKAWLVHGGDGTDEISIAAPTRVSAVEGGTVRDFTLHPEDAGLPYHPFERIMGGTPAENAQAFRALLDGAPGAYRDAVLLNAAAALVVADKTGSLPEGVEMARASIDSGAAKAKVAALARLTHG
jgi:anthranilate phosphoribosyltransferase